MREAHPAKPSGRQTTRGPTVVPALIGLLIAGGCSNSGESAETPERSAATSEADSVSPATGPADSELATTAQPPPAQTTGAATVATNTAADPTTAPVDQTPEAGVLAAVGRAERTFLEVMRDPDLDVDHGVAAIQAVTAPGSDARSSFESTYRSRRGMALSLVPNIDVPFAITSEGDVVVIAADEALVQVCVIDSDIIVRNQLNADGDEEQRIVGDEVVTARRSAQRFVLNSEGQWQLASSDVIAEYPGETTCPGA